MKPRIAVIGVGGAGGNAVNNMIAAGLKGADFIVANTDAQALEVSMAQHRIQLGASITEGLGAGSKPEIGEAAAEESVEDIRAAIAGCHMVFIAAGMGGGTGTGAASVIARAAKAYGILTVAVVTKPFQFEGSRRLRVAEAGISELRNHVDTLLIIPNQNLFRVANERTTFAEAFVLADQVLYSGIACIVDLILKEGHINLDLADVKTVLGGMGTAMMGTGEAAGEQRAIVAAEEAIVNPLLDDVTLKGAKSLLLSITGGRDLTLWEVDEAANRVRQEVDPEANIIVGATFDEALGDKVRVSIVASGMARTLPPPLPRNAEPPGWPSRSQRSPNGTGGTSPPDDFHRRIRDAIDDGANPNAHAHAQEFDDASGADEGWRAPGGVIIREGSPQISSHASGTHNTNRTRPNRPQANDEARAGWYGNGDEADTSGRESHRRPVSEPSDSYHPQPESPPQKPGLLRRLAGVGRKMRDVAEEKDSSAARRERHGRSGRGAEQVDLPVFFGRGKR